MGNRNRWWLTLIGVGMVAYGVVVVWHQVLESRLYSHVQLDCQALIPALLIGVVGAIALVLELLRQPDDPRPNLLAPAIEPYLAAWRRLWTTRWLLWVYGSIAAIAAGGVLAQQLMTLRYMPRQFEHVTSRPPTINMISLLSMLSGLAKRAFEHFVPRVGLIYSAPDYAIAAVIIVLFVLPSVIRLLRQPEYEGRMGFFAFCMVLAALSCAAAAYSWMTFWGRFVLAGVGARSEDARFTLVYMEIAGLVASIVLSAALTAGVLGSLARSRNGDQDIKRTFLSDAVRFFATLTGFCLIIELATAAVYLPYYAGPGARPSSLSMWSPILRTLFSTAFLLLIFAPFGIVTRSMNLIQSIRHSFRVWKQTWKRTIVLIALGSFLCAIALIPGRLIPLLVERSSWILTPWAALSTVISVAISALILLATWEFYTANAQEPVGAVDEEV